MYKVDLCVYSTFLNASPCSGCPRPSRDYAHGKHFGVERTFVTRTGDLIVQCRSYVSKFINPMQMFNTVKAL